MTPCLLCVRLGTIRIGGIDRDGRDDTVVFCSRHATEASLLNAARQALRRRRWAEVEELNALYEEKTDGRHGE